jgi:hypothetical protein
MANLISVKTVQGMGRRGITENGGEGEFQFDIFDTL